MIIGQFSEAFPPIIDGVAQVVKNYAYCLNKNNDKCYVITIKVPDWQDNYDFDVLRYKSFRVIFKKNYRTGFPKLDNKFYKNLQSIDFDIVHSHSPFSAGKLGLDIARKKGVPIVMTFHTKFRDIFKQIVKNDLVADLMVKQIMKYYNKVDDVWTVSESVVETLREYGYKGDVFIAENACDLSTEIDTVKAKNMIYEKFGLPSNAVLFAFVGQLINPKNIKLIAKALKIVDNNGYDFRMLYVGDGVNKDELEKTIKSYNLNSKVILTGNIYDRDFLKNIYAASNSIIFPSLFDTSSLVIKEAAAMRCPMILVEKSTTAQGIIDGYNGFLVKNEANSLAEKIEMLIKKPETAKIAGSNAFKTLYRSWDDVTLKARNRYQYLIEKNKIR